MEIVHSIASYEAHTKLQLHKKEVSYEVCYGLDYGDKNMPCKKPNMDNIVFFLNFNFNK